MKKGQLTSSGMDIPDWVYEALARCFLPKIQRYYESEEGKKVLEQHRAERDKKHRKINDKGEKPISNNSLFATKITRGAP